VTELTATEIEQGFKRPLRNKVEHTFCKTVSTLRVKDALDMARDPTSWSSCYCCVCGRRLPADQFVWTLDREPVGS
jgi:hypothetical protein